MPAMALANNSRPSAARATGVDVAVTAEHTTSAAADATNRRRIAGGIGTVGPFAETAETKTTLITVDTQSTLVTAQQRFSVGSVAHLAEWFSQERVSGVVGLFNMRRGK